MNCTPGILAYLSSDCVNEGLVVEVLCAAHVSGLPAWHCRSKTRVLCTTSLTAREHYATEFIVEDRYLRPINGLPVTEEIREELTA